MSPTRSCNPVATRRQEHKFFFYNFASARRNEYTIKYIVDDTGNK
jgi:hypothetical protein